MKKKGIVNWLEYAPKVVEFYDEMINTTGGPRWGSVALFEHLNRLSEADMVRRQAEINTMIETLGISFSVYSANTACDRNWPLDFIPRVIDGETWDSVTAGLQQRLHAINLFLQDVYNDGHIFKDGVIPEELVKKSPHYRPQCVGITPPLGVWAHICGTDLVRGADGAFYVLEDNLRVPSGVSYMLENREVMYRVAADLFGYSNVRSSSDYASNLYNTLVALAPRANCTPSVVVLTPGHFNSAYFEHVYLARQLGVELAEASDMVVVDDIVYLRMVGGLRPVDVIYRRIDDWFLDPKEMFPDSLIGVPGLMRAWRRGRVAIANAPGAGVADDKAVCSYIPDIIRYYTGEEALLSNVPTWRLWIKEERDEAFGDMRSNVYKPANEAGGKGVVIGRYASSRELAATKRRIQARPRDYVAQPLILLSTSPSVCGRRVEPRHLDLRPFTLQGENMFTTDGGLTRVARRRGSFIVNSSQGGGSKDTWIIDKVDG